MNWKIIRREGKARLGLMAVLAILLALISTVPGLAQTGPNTMNFQGRLLDNSGDPVSGVTRCMRFRMCSDSGCTNQRWPSSGYEYHAVTTESGTYKAGLFTVTLGDSVNYTDYPIEPTLLYDYDTLYLEIGVSDAYGDLCDTRTDYDTMTPRSQLHANAYAQRSRRVRTEENDDAYLITVANSGQGGGIYAQTTNSYPGAIPGYFYALSPSGYTTGVSVRNDSTTDTARAGYFYAAGSSGGTYGIWAKNDSASSSAAAGYFEATGGIGVYGSSSTGLGVKGVALGGGSGVYGVSNSGYGVIGESIDFYGIWGESSSGYPAIEGYNNSNGHGVAGISNSGIGVYGAGSSYGVHGISTASHGVYGQSIYGHGVHGYSSNGYAGYFAGDVHVVDTLSKGSGSFKIDHPLDPENQYLYHSFVESPDMMNIYNGNVILDEKGEAWVELPDWFEALNGGKEHRSDFRYQLTPIGAPGPNLYIAEEITGNRFRIAGGTPGSKVSWQVTGIRHDPYAEANRIPVEEAKPPEERGTYLHPEAYGQPETMGLDYEEAHQPQGEKR